MVQLIPLQPIPRFLNYSDPEIFPDLYRFQDRLDENHLTARAGLGFSRQLASDVASLLRWENRPE